MLNKVTLPIKTAESMFRVFI